MIRVAMAGVAITGVALLVPGLAVGEPPGTRDPDWPCQQIKVPGIPLAAVWSGPAVDPRDESWKNDPAVSDLVATVAPRREPIEQAQARIHDFAERAGEPKRARLMQVFAGVFDVLDQERGSVMAGLDRSGARQKERAAEIRSDNEKLRALQAESGADPEAVETLTKQVMWETEVFQDRRQALSYVCDVPGQIEQRLFALAHQIQEELE